jgi:hypothetical protein
MVKTMDKLEEAIRKVEEAVKSTADALDVSNAKLICTLSSVAVNTVLRELEIQLRREELFNEMASLSSPEFAEVVQMEADAVGPEPEQGVVQMNNDQNECKFFSRDEKGYCDVPDVHKKHCPTCAYRGKCYVDDVHSRPWTTVVRDMERDELLEQVTKLTLQVERLKADNDRLRRSRAHR